MNKNEINEKFIQGIDQLAKEFHNIKLIHDINVKFAEMVGNNEDIQKPNYFWWWLQRIYSGDMLLELTRIVDTQKDSFSLTNLLKKLKNTQYLSADTFLITYLEKRDGNTYGNSPEEIKQQFFEEVNNSCVNIMIDSDIAMLNEQFEPLRLVRDKFITHNDKNKEKYGMHSSPSLD